MKFACLARGVPQNVTEIVNVFPVAITGQGSKAKTSGIFNGFWPAEPGEVVLSATTLTKANRFLGVGEKQIDATLTIVFERSGSALVPVRYQYSQDRRLTPNAKFPVRKSCKLS